MTAAVFYYHRVGPFRAGAPRKMNVEPASFRAHMKALAGASNPVSLDALVDGPIPRGAVAVTFDDGYRDLLDHALPTLRELKIPATFFIVAGGVGSTDTWNEIPGVPREPTLAWDELARIRDAGLSIGSHSMTHPRLDGVSADELRREVGESKRVIEAKLGIRVRHFAYPQGRHSPEAERAVQAAGYDAGWATKKGRILTDEDRFAARRIPVSGHISGLRFRWEHFLRRIGVRR